MINGTKLFFNCCRQPLELFWAWQGMHDFAYSFLYRGDICGICEMAYLKVNCSRAQTFVGNLGDWDWDWDWDCDWEGGGKRANEFEIYSNFEQTATCCNSPSDCCPCQWCLSAGPRDFSDLKIYRRQPKCESDSCGCSGRELHPRLPTPVAGKLVIK